ncbi:MULTISPECIES: response regulator [Leptolyngbya]|jgi:GAF domain-containing protein/class 3 adenylate cyclase|uniref:histidine kinase n=1 Tax=Leptolyngbya boryana NIES-2135 TaxID=1973484 RepID=A0A1Z4JNV5_LEPBY|nr:MULTISPECIES: response regulator [Leptolyngbya]BAY58445.1 adenylate cyclase [Leptolyngbya boryana NIES-2135]MBD1858878.1 response regulator [Leptolyngbya sp. FACHB-1624]MBD2368120.1 response regulator [Leptolyngbya sp. FACHB-161]MBD2374644.1 response regulator [Leptolyngbya sp. FACHB-238]MBD2399066.1 response regulator [Leptolyngbya sp. FACHB-239]
MKSRDIQKQKLLVVDDEPDNLDLLYRTFYREFKVLRAENGPTALDILEKEGDVAVIISDQRMPMMSGTEFLSLTATKYPDIIRIILTGYTDVEDLVEAINSGKVFKYVTKPWSDMELRDVVKSAIDTHTLLRTRTEELRRTLQRESLLNAVTSTIRSALSYDEILQTIVETIGKNFGVSGAIVCPFQDGEIQENSFTYWNHPELPQPNLVPTIWETYEVEVIPDVQVCDRIEEDPTRHAAYADADIHSTLMVPLICQQKLIAVLALHESGKSRIWQPEEVDLIHAVADQAALALSQAHAYEQVRALAKREALINTITTAIRSSLDPQEIFAAITQQLGQGLQVDGCALSLWKEGDEFVQCVGLHDSSWEHKTPPESHLPQSSVPIEGNPVLKQLIVTQQPIVLSDLKQHPQFNISEFRTPARALLVVPLIADGKIIGSISLRQNHRTRNWQSSEIQLAQSVASQAAIAVQQSRLYQTTRQQAEKLLQLDQQKTEFFQNISHEFRTPLTLMVGPLESAVATGQGLSAEQSAIALRNSRRLLRLVNQLLDLQRLDAGRMQPKFQACDLVEFVSQIVDTFRPYCEKKGLSLITQLEPCAPVYLDLEKFDKVLYNLLSNAMKFTPAGQSISVSLEMIDDRCRLKVRDTGIGIREDQIPHLFERFRQAEGSENRSFEGTGLGLALVKELVELHSGQINVDSTYGQGTTFTIDLHSGAEHLPPEQVSHAQHELQANRAAVELADIEVELQEDYEPEPILEVGENHARVLVVDDNPDLRSYVSGILRGQGYTVLTARNGAEGFEQVKTHRPSLIVTDLMMPIVSGLDMIRMIRAQDDLKGTPIVLLTAKADEDTRLEGVERGADAYLSKPFNDRELLAEVRNLLALKENEQRVSRINSYLTDSVLSRFLPQTLVKRAAQGELTLDLRPEPRMITVLFSDIVGFTQLSNTLRSRRVAELLNEYLTAMTRCVFNNGGTVDKFMGDAILAIFGAPEELTPNEQVRRAIATAREMYSILDNLNNQWMAQGIDRVQFRCGIHQGTAVVGMFGGEERSDYTAIGPSVNIAARLQEAAAPGAILISAAVADYVDEDNITKESPLKLKGVDETVLTFSVSPYPDAVPTHH